MNRTCYGFLLKKEDAGSFLERFFCALKNSRIKSVSMDQSYRYDWFLEKSAAFRAGLRAADHQKVINFALFEK